MQSLEKRIAALEQAKPEVANLEVFLITPKDGETNEQAIRKAGHDPDAANTMFVCFVGIEPNESASCTA
jgi:hypothetical protein